jgi:hypothetical protein
MGIKRKPHNKPTANSTQSCLLKPKLRQYNESYLSYGFTNVTINSEEWLQCVLNVSILAAWLPLWSSGQSS